MKCSGIKEPHDRVEDFRSSRSKGTKMVLELD